MIKKQVMKTIKYILGLGLILMLVSCKNEIQKTSPKGDINSTINKKIIPNKVQKKDSVQEIKTPDLNVSVKNIKSQTDNVTTSFLVKSKTLIYQEKPKTNFFGVYNLIKNESDPVGKMIIYDDVNPYKYDKDTDEFVEINLWSKGIKVFNDKIQIGNSKEDLLAILGEGYTKYKDDILIYKDNENRIGFFRLKNDKIDRIKIGKYKDSVSIEKILKYIWW